MRLPAVALVLACGGGAPKPPAAAPVDACIPAYAEYEARWRTARSADLVEAGFDAASIDEVVRGEVARLPTHVDLDKLRTQYTVIALFLPDTPWPRALDAAEVAITHCGEEAPRP